MKKWVTDTDHKGTLMVIEEDGSEDGRLVAGKVKPTDAERIVRTANAHDKLVAALEKIAQAGDVRPGYAGEIAREALDELGEREPR
jgi:hypothetical protein